MPKEFSKKETHLSNRSGWIRAAVLGANDGALSVSSLLVGIAGAGKHDDLLLAGIAALTAGALSMAAGEYVSVQSQHDIEQSDIIKEKNELKLYPQNELEELTQIYQQRGLDRELAQQVAYKLSTYDALGSHIRDEIGITDTLSAKPLQAAFSSALSFICGAIVPVLSVVLFDYHYTSLITLIFLAIMGAITGLAGGISIIKSSLRLTVWGAISMGVSLVIGHLTGMSIS